MPTRSSLYYSSSKRKTLQDKRTLKPAKTSEEDSRSSLYYEEDLQNSVKT
jgi:hypothetical protein